MYLLIVLLPAIGSFISGFFGRYLGKQGSMIVTTGSVLFSCIFSFIAFYEVGLAHSPVYIELMSWINSGFLNVNWGFQFDSLTVTMLIVVTVVSTLVHIYSIEYMYHDPHIPRFFSYLSLFTFFMLVLVTSNNFVQLFVGWEGVGVSSYLLINFWFTRIQANKSAMKAMIVNRVGDFALSLGIIGIYYIFKSLDFSTVFALSYLFYQKSFLFFNLEFDVITIIGILLFIGAVGKSAQIGLHTWLPDAMEGPTPVSALIHAATMVTAGVFLLLRSSPLLEYSSMTLFIITVIGSLTAFLAATTGVVQNDLKRVIAYSTCSQLGYMVFACGISCYSVSMFHLMNHAFFKALLFLSAGSVIHALSDEQDMRKMGGLAKVLPFTYTMILIGSLSLMGVPFLTGFYSKDVILELAYSSYHIHGNFAHWLGTISAFFTSFYSFRLIYLTFYGTNNSYRSIVEHAHDAPVIMIIPLSILCIGSIFVGYFTKDMMIGLGTDFWGNSLFTLPKNLILVESEFIPYYIKLIPVIFSIVGALLATLVYKYMSRGTYKFTSSPVGRIIYTHINRKWNFDIIYNEFIVKYILSFGYRISFKLFDRGFIEVIGPTGIVNSVKKVARTLSRVQSGMIYHYTFVFFIGVVLLSLVSSIDITYINPEYYIILVVILILNSIL
uniref:NADH-ubiquinone oxidoreductase chain 5 n=1 Tax=Imasa heleensis TaxID=2772037 RepID=A0A893DCH1_9EUKA|nr:NADH dehydrogenase subunit 5 [Imasa heleensis]QRR29732.1 NADH dehydrogenase subunit 5 [Imasa heleensis]